MSDHQFYLNNVALIQKGLANLSLLRAPISQNQALAVGIVDADMLKKVWDKFDYYIDICRATKYKHTEYF